MFGISTSVQTFIPVSALASASSFSLFLQSLKVVREVRGLKAPPRRILAPTLQTALAVSRVERPLTEQARHDDELVPPT